MRVSRTILIPGLLALGLSPAAAAQTGRDVDCEPAPDLQTRLNAIPPAATCGGDLDCRARLETQWREVFEARPRDMRAHQAYQRVWSKVDAAAVERLYKEKMAAHPEDPFFVTAYGSSLGASDTENEIATYRKALALDPTYVWAHRQLAIRLGSLEAKERRDPKKARVHLRAWLETCPADPDALRVATELGDPDLAGELLTAARRSLEKENSDWAIKRYEGLWAAEFKIRPTAEHDALRKIVRADLERLRALSRPDSLAWWKTLQIGAGLADDKEQRDLAQSEMVKRFPCDPATVRLQIADWERAHPMPSPTAEAATRREYNAARFAFDTERARACPAHRLIAPSRMRVARQIPDLSDKELEDVVDDYVAARALGAPPAGSATGDPAVDICLSRRLRLDKVPALMRDRAEVSLVEPPKDAPESRRMGYELGLWRREVDAIWAQARLDNLLDRKAERDTGMKALEEKVAHAPRFDGGRTEAELAWLRAEIAEHEGRKTDAAAFYQQAFAGLRSDEFMLDATRKALRRVGVSEAVVATLNAPPRSVRTVGGMGGHWSEIDKTLPEAALPLVGGGQWRIAELKGKRTLINVWATWCKPCMMELPELQKIYDRIKDRTDVAVVSFNVDSQSGLVGPFLKEKGFTFPVTLAFDYWLALNDGEMSLPTNWIVDGRGVARETSQGFGSSERWADEIAAKLLHTAQTD
jgi:thiol-disulfide isomerase/thioredoxin